jgi:hypothetical protein
MGTGMQTLQKLLSTIVLGILQLSVCYQPSSHARGSQAHHDDPWNLEHIERLPPEVRTAVTLMCRDHQPRAGHYFATYFDNSRLMKLHFEHLHCDRQPTFCREDSSCLHQGYLSMGSHYRLIRSYYSRNSD